MEAIGADIQCWLQEEWYPEALYSGLKFLVFITPKCPIAKLSIKTANRGTAKDGFVDIRYFCEVDEALLWCKDVQLDHARIVMVK